MHDFTEQEKSLLKNWKYDKEARTLRHVETWNAAIEEAIRFMVTNKLEEGLYDRMRKELKK